MFPDVFHTSRLTLRPIAAGDAGQIFDAYARDPEVTRFLTWRPHHDIADTQAYIARCTGTPALLGRTYVLTGRQDGIIRGAIDLRHAGPHRLEFGYLLARAYWGNGLMTETLRDVVGRALADPSIFRIGAVCDVDNIGSARVMEKAGLLREGALRRWSVHPNISDEPRDCFCYAKVR